MTSCGDRVVSMVTDVQKTHNSLFRENDPRYFVIKTYCFVIGRKQWKKNEMRKMAFHGFHILGYLISVHKN